MIAQPQAEVPMSRVVPFALILALAGCATGPEGDTKILQATLDDYATTLRWGDIPQAIAYIDPKVLQEHPVTGLDLERFKQVRIAGYREQPWSLIGEGRARQVVEIEIINRNTATVRSIVDMQIWRWDPVAKHWWLETGLPRIDQQ
jgi:hypothetical protein